MDKNYHAGESWVLIIHICMPRIIAITDCKHTPKEKRITDDIQKSKKDKVKVMKGE